MVHRLQIMNKKGKKDTYNTIFFAFQSRIDIMLDGWKREREYKDGERGVGQTYTHQHITWQPIKRETDGLPEAKEATATTREEMKAIFIVSYSKNVLIE